MFGTGAGLGQAPYNSGASCPKTTILKHKSALRFDVLFDTLSLQISSLFGQRIPPRKSSMIIDISCESLDVSLSLCPQSPDLSTPNSLTTHHAKEHHIQMMGMKWPQETSCLGSALEIGKQGMRLLFLPNVGKFQCWSPANEKLFSLSF